MSMWVAGAIVVAATIGTVATVWNSNQQRINQQKRQKGLLQDAERKEQQIKKEQTEAQSIAEQNAKRRSLRRQRAKSNTILTGAKGLETEETTQKKTLGA